MAQPGGGATAAPATPLSRRPRAPPAPADPRRLEPRPRPHRPAPSQLGGAAGYQEDVMHHDLTAIQPGWAVYDTNEDKLGDVMEAGPGYVLVQKGLLFVKDIYIPESAIAETDAANGRVYINVAKGDVDSMGWDQPPAGDSGQGQGADYDYGVVGQGGAAGTTTTTTTETATTGATTGNITGDVMDEADSRRLTLHEEELQAQTRREQAGEVAVSKRVVQENQQVEVPVTHEEVEVRRVRVNRADAGSEPAFADEGETIRGPVTAEAVEVTKTPRVVEEIEISKRPVTERQTVSDTVRREEADISREGDVTVAGDGGMTSDPRGGDLVGAGTDRFQRTSVDDVAGVDDADATTGTADDDVRDITGI